MKFKLIKNNWTKIQNYNDNNIRLHKIIKNNLKLFKIIKIIRSNSI